MVAPDLPRPVERIRAVGAARDRLDLEADRRMPVDGGADFGIGRTGAHRGHDVVRAPAAAEGLGCMSMWMSVSPVRFGTSSTG